MTDMTACVPRYAGTRAMVWMMGFAILLLSYVPPYTLRRWAAAIYRLRRSALPYGSSVRTLGLALLRGERWRWFAQYVVRGRQRPIRCDAHPSCGPPWDSTQIDAAMHDTKSLRVELRKPIRVMILYGTAMATEGGPVQFFDDIYGHDRKLEALLSLRPVNSAPEAARL
jgi:hypothetical protein